MLALCNGAGLLPAVLAEHGAQAEDRVNNESWNIAATMEAWAEREAIGAAPKKYAISL